MWGDKRDDPQSRLLAEALEDIGLAIGNDGSPTFFRKLSSFSAIDMIAHSPALPIVWKRSQDTMYRSYFHMYTDGTANGATQTSTLAVHLSSQHCNWSERISRALSSTGADLLVMSKAFFS